MDSKIIFLRNYIKEKEMVVNMYSDLINDSDLSEKAKDSLLFSMIFEAKLLQKAQNELQDLEQLKCEIVEDR